MLKRFKESITKARGLLESPQNGYVVDDEILTKYQLKQELIKLQKLGKQAILSSTFLENKKAVQQFHNLLLNNTEMYNKFCIDPGLNFKFGKIFLINEGLSKSLKNTEILYVTLLDEVVAIFKYKKSEHIKTSKNKLVVCTKSLIWKDLNQTMKYRMYDLILDWYFKWLDNDTLLSDDLYSNDGKKVLYNLANHFVNFYYLYHVEGDKIMYRIESEEDLEYDFAKYFGDSGDFAKYKFLLSTKEIKL